MYSYEDRIRTVELYIKLGKRVRPKSAPRVLVDLHELLQSFSCLE